MSLHALIVDDDAGILRQVRNILKSLGHTSDEAADMETARTHLSSGDYAYILLDLEIPVVEGELFRKENGVNLLREIRKTKETQNIPVIVMTGHGNDSPELAVSVMKTGAVDYIAKPLNGGKLDNAIRELLANQSAVSTGNPSPESLFPFSAEQRKMVIYSDHVTLCGVTVWQDVVQSDMRTVLVRLSEKTDDGYKRVSGMALNRLLNRNASNHVSGMIRDFKQRCTEVMAQEKGLSCGKHDVIGPATSGGYHLKEWIDVVIDGQEDDDICAEPATSASSEQLTLELNLRQQKILERIQAGERIQQKDLRSMLHRELKRYWSPATIKRDISGLKDAGLIITHADGYYIYTGSAEQ